MSPNIPAHQALRLQVETSLGRRPDRDWVRSSSRPRNRWIDQRRQDHQRSPADLWRAAIQRGHTGVTLRSSTTTRWRRRRHQVIWSCYTGRWSVDYYIWYSEEGTERGRSPPRPLFAVLNVTAHPSTASIPITLLLYNGPLLRGFNVLTKGLNPHCQMWELYAMMLSICLYVSLFVRFVCRLWLLKFVKSFARWQNIAFLSYRVRYTCFRAVRRLAI